MKENNPPISVEKYRKIHKKADSSTSRLDIRKLQNIKDVIGLQRVERINSLDVIDSMIQSEDELQVACYTWAQTKGYTYDARMVFLQGVQQESPRSRAYGYSLKMKGMRAGHSDLYLPVMSGIYGALFIELKYGNNDITREQAEFLHLMRSAGNATCVVHDKVSLFAKRVLEYLNDPINFVSGS